MKVLAINGSPRKNGNTSIMLGWIAEELAKEGIETEIIKVGGQVVRGCLACGACGKNKDMRCIQKDDIVNDIIQKMADTQGLVMASPVYFADLTPELKAVIDRSGYVLKANGNPMRRKAGAGLAVARRAGHVHTFDSINHFFGIMDMYTVGSSYWNVATARTPGEVNEDEEGQSTMRTLGQNLAYILKKLA